MEPTSSHDEDDHAVGYGNPPKEYRFKKGQSGNPKGRPKKRQSIQDLVQEELGSKITVNGTLMTKARAVAVSLVNDCIKGKPGARQLLLPMISKPDDALEDFDPEIEDRIVLQEWLEKVGKQQGGSHD